MIGPRVLAVGALLLLVPASAARADDDAATTASGTVEPRVEVSTDGRHWAPRLDDAWFDPGLRWVPGDVRTTGLLLRGAGAGPEDAELVLDRDQGPAVPGSPEVSARLGGGGWVRLGGGAALDVDAIGTGQVVPLSIRVRLPLSAPDTTMRQRTALSLRLRGVGATANDLPSGADGPAPLGAVSSIVADRGTDLPWWLPASIVLLVGAAGFVRTRHLVPSQEIPRG